MTNSTIDILMATYNGEKYVREQIESIQRQTYTEWRLLVSDDCSSDGTLVVVDNLAATDHRIVVVNRNVRHGGAKENFLALAHQAVAPYVMFCDQDDVWLPNKVELALTKMHELESELDSSLPLLVFTDMKVVNSDLCMISESFECFSNIDSSRTAFRQVLAQSVGAGCTMMLNRSLVKLVTRALTVEYIKMHDHWAMLVASAFGGVAHVAESTVLYRQHGSNSIGAARYSMIGMFKSFNQKRESFYLDVLQAELFLYTYGSDLGISKKKIVSEYALLLDAKNFFGRLWHLVRSRAWKPGFRKIGQIACALIGPGPGVLRDARMSKGKATC